MIDANINRAAEGLRVLEDVARFQLNDAPLSEVIKKLRHSIRHAFPSCVLHRDTQGDVGTTITTEEELNRSSLHDIVIASSNRCCEALRVIEEGVKLEASTAPVKEIRYAIYDTSQQLLRKLGSTTPSRWRLCFVCTASDCVLPWQETVKQAVSCGCDCIQVREKSMSTTELIEHVNQVTEIVSGKAAVIVNDRIDVMLATNATGVHLGINDMAIHEARTICGDQYVVGATVHSLEEAKHAATAGADYFGVGSMFKSSTKESEVKGVDLLSDIHDAFLHIPLLAIGGITSENCGELYAACECGIAVSRTIAHSKTPAMTASELLNGVSIDL